MMKTGYRVQGTGYSKRLPTSYEPRAHSYILAALFIACFILPISAQAATYYVASNGDDANPGTLNAPFRTIQNGVNTLNVGDTLYVRAGTYHEAVLIAKSGTQDAPITISGYPGERPIIDGEYILPGGAVGRCDPKNPSRCFVWGQLVGISGDYIVFHGFEVMRSLGRGIIVNREIHNRNHNNEINDCWVHDSRDSGILLYQTDHVLVQNSKVYGNSNFAPYDRSALVLDWGGGLAARYVTNLIIRKNEVFHTWGEGILPMNSEYITIEDNIVYDNYAVNIYCARTSNVLVQRNISYSTNDGVFLRSGSPSPGLGFADENDGGVEYTHDVVVVNNLMMGNGCNFFWWGGTGEGGFANSLIAHNTLVNAHKNYDTGVQACGMEIARGAHTNCRIENNIILQNEGNLVDDDDYHKMITFSHNLWSHSLNPDNVFQHRASSPDDVIGDPQLEMTGPTGVGLLTADYFKIKESSPAKDKAKVIAEVTKDFFGTMRGGVPDIGAHEFTDTSIKYGDVSGDGVVSAYDAALTAQAAVGLITLTSEQAQAADVSGDNQVSAYDAALIAQKAVGLIDKFPIE